MADASERTVLVRVTGTDRPGVTHGLMSRLGAVGATIGDVEQVVLRGHLALGVVATLAPDANLGEVADWVTAEGLHLHVEDVPSTPTDRRLGVIVTVMGRTVSPGQFAAVAGAVSAAGGNIDRIARLSRFPVVSYELTVLGVDTDTLRAPLLSLARTAGVDIAIQPDGLLRRSQRLVVMDVDSTLIRNEVIELLAEEAGALDQVAAITARAMAGEVDFEEALRERVRLLAGLDAAALDRARTRLRLTPGARTFVRTLRRLGFRVAIVSGGFTYFTDHLAAVLGVDHAVANVLEMKDGRLTGELVGPVVDRRRKADVLAEIAEAEGIPLDQTVAVGDGANDIDMLARAGLGVAFNAKPVVVDVADTSVNVPYLDAILFVLGVRRSEIEAADKAGRG